MKVFEVKSGDETIEVCRTRTKAQLEIDYLMDEGVDKELLLCADYEPTEEDKEIWGDDWITPKEVVEIRKAQRSKPISIEEKIITPHISNEVELTDTIDYLIEEFDSFNGGLNKEQQKFERDALLKIKKFVEKVYEF